MSIFHASMKTFSRRDGQSAVAAVAYRSATRLWDERRGTAADYREKGGVAAAFILLPDNAPAWMKERSMLWNMAEWAEKRCNSVVAREWQIGLPAELSAAAREKIVRLFCHKLIARYGVAVDAAIHLPNREGDQKMFAAVNGMFTSLNGLPPYTIKLEIPRSSQFNEASYQGALKRQSNADLLNAVFSPPTQAQRPAMATVTLRQDVLQVKELLSRVKPRASTRGSRDVASKISMRK